jgi:activating signal cointegrator 1
MKCLTLPQPWATLVMIGAKILETRPRSTTHRGILGIHASKRFTREQQMLLVQEPYRSVLLAAEYSPVKPLPLGAIIGTVELVNVIATKRIWCEHGLLRNGLPADAYVISQQEWKFGDFSPGRFAWKLASPASYAMPIPVQGAPGLWEWDETTATADEREP